MELLKEPSSQASIAPTTEIDEDSEGPQTSDGDDVIRSRSRGHNIFFFGGEGPKLRSHSRSRSRGRNAWPTGEYIKHLIAMHQPQATRSLEEVALPPVMEEVAHLGLQFLVRTRDGC